MNKYSTEARERWGDTSAYREHEQKRKNYTNLLRKVNSFFENN